MDIRSSVIKHIRPKLHWWILGGGGFVVIAYLFFASVGDSAVLSKEFTDARVRAASVSRDIVSLTAATNEKIVAVNMFDLRRNTDQALALIQEARRTNAAAYERAFTLSEELRGLAVSVASVPRTEQRVAYEAIAIELSLVSEFIAYTGDLTKFFDALTRAIRTNAPGDRSVVTTLVNDVNRRVTKINELNAVFVNTMSAFDRGF